MYEVGGDGAAGRGSFTGAVVERISYRPQQACAQGGCALQAGACSKDFDPDHAYDFFEFGNQERQHRHV
jgi:hypothetical protein